MSVVGFGGVLSETDGGSESSSSVEGVGGEREASEVVERETRELGGI